ncbi:MAG: histidinol phosphate phosphatase [Deltaproteobacteria bacterium]|nr:histidinol phosphate phosphatase [Deltaproteobacteria bacterium]MBI3388800.1 histidinol phosphate phosphatase [Deltaproteobacteria bacterium]
MDKRLEIAIAAARAAGEIALKYFRTALTVERKADHSPVTVADRECERRIVEVLTKAFPDYGVVGEEFGTREGAGARWIVDPIDGTKSFIRGIPYFATLIGLEEEGEIILGVIYAPAIDDLLYAQKGHGAFDKSGPIHVSDRATLRESMIVFGGLNVLRRAGYWPAFEQLVERSGRQRGYGDYFGHTFVARGQAEAMIEIDLKPWDMAALKIIIEEAGGRFTDFAGVPSIYTGTALATNGRVHDEILDLVRHQPNLGGRR